MKLAYVILHYMASKDTIECARSIEEATKKSHHETEVIIVDNGSENDSLSDLNKEFKDDHKVTILRNEDNLGFAKGNNVGFRYAKDTLQADFIVLLNNDTIIEQADFNEKIVSKYTEKKFSVLGPDIVTADGYHQNPGDKQKWDTAELLLFRFKKRVQILLSYANIHTSEKKNVDYKSETVIGDIDNTILHGACMIFSPLFIRKFDGLYDNTFLYWEEDILKLQADAYGFVTLYSSELVVFHKEDVATNMVKCSAKERERRKLRQLVKSSREYSKLKRIYQKKKFFFSIITKVAQKSKKEDYNLDLDIPISYVVSMVFRRGIMLIRGKIQSLGMRKSGKIVFIGKNVKLICKSKMSLGTGVTVGQNTYIDALSRRGLVLGNSCSIGSGTIIRCSGNYKNLGVGFSMGDNSSLADNCFVGATGGVRIGNDVICGQNVRFHSSNHNFENTSIPIRKQGIRAKGICIGNDCWIGAGAVFCDGVDIGDGCVVGANAVVTKSFPKDSVIGGNPAKIIKTRS